MSRKIAVAFGRMNPPHRGHVDLIKRTMAAAPKHLIVVSRGQDKKKNPLSADQKVEFIKKAMPRVNVVAATDKMRTIIEVLKSIDGKYDEVVIALGDDRKENFEALLNKYNGKEYNFSKISFTTETRVAGLSATDVRNAAKAGDYEKFKSYAMPGLKETDIKRMFMLLQKTLNEEIDDISDEELMAEMEEVELDWADIVEFYDDDELVYEDMIDEDLSMAQRMKKKLVMKRNKKKLALKRKIALRRTSNKDRLKGRATKAARNVITKRLLKGRDKSKMSAAEKNAVERRVKKLSPVMKRLTTRLMPQVRKIERSRLSNK